MNATEIIKNIITDGIDQCKEPIWERLLMPDFDVPDPRSDYPHFNSAEEWLDSELHKIALENIYFEKEYYASKSFMPEEEYNNADFSLHYKNYVPDYFEYKKKWAIDNSNVLAVKESRAEIIHLLDLDVFNERIFHSLRFSQRTKNIIKGSHYLWDFELDGVYLACKIFWDKSRTKEGRENVIFECEYNWFFHIHEDFNYDLVVDTRRQIKELKLNYIARWRQLLEKQKNAFQKWEENRKNYRIQQFNRKKEVENIRIDYLRLKPDSIITFSEEILKCSSYNFEFEKNFKIDFKQETKLLLVEYTLPTLENLPNIKETKYLSSKNEYKNVLVSKSELSRLFDETVYGITLRSIYEILINDTAKTIDAINFNGWIKSINKATGKRENNCIVSIQVQHNDFMDIELSSVEPKSCFKFFKGVGSSKLYGITAIQPIIQIQKNDKRFVNTQDIEFDNSTNLALIDWEDFEHLIRELFEKEFRSNGGEVKVTQASRDGGVDAIAFDPDPIRGGKIVIQAKRYTNTVGVSAVRDLFGTVMNEGANKGILVTTSDYGPDSYEFAKGKPITLLNGANLLYLLEKHGTKARIDIKEAKRIMDENK